LVVALAVQTQVLVDEDILASLAALPDFIPYISFNSVLKLLMTICTFLAYLAAKLFGFGERSCVHTGGVNSFEKYPL